MYYVLNDDLDLVSYELLPFGLKDRQGNVGFFGNARAYELLTMCEGNINFDMPFFSDVDRALLENMEKENIIRKKLSEDDVRIIQRKKYNNRFIKDVQFALTGRCNFKCRHCYLSAKDNENTELPFEKIAYILDELRDAGVFRISITGGECLIRKDILLIFDKIKENGMELVALYTNGWLVDEKLLDELEKRGMHPEFSISFDGVGYHDYLRGVDGAEKKLDKVFRMLRNRGFSVDIEMCVFRQNIDSIIPSLEYLSEVGVYYAKINPVIRTGSWKEESPDDDISDEEIYEVYLKCIEEYLKRKINIAVQFSGFFLKYPNEKGYYIPVKKSASNLDEVCVCAHARNVMYISEEGIAMPCPSMSSFTVKDDFPSILDIGLQKCLNDSYFMKIIDTRASEVINYNEECRSCEYSKECFGGCRASGCMQNSDILEMDKSTCLMFKGGYIDRLEQLVKNFDL